MFTFVNRKLDDGRYQVESRYVLDNGWSTSVVVVTDWSLQNAVSRAIEDTESFADNYVEGCEVVMEEK